MLRVRQPANWASDISEITWSATMISPWLGVSSPAIRFNSVVLPEPLGPIRPRNVALRHVEVDAVEDVEPLRAAVKELVDAFEREQSRDPQERYSC